MYRFSGSVSVEQGLVASATVPIAVLMERGYYGAGTQGEAILLRRVEIAVSARNVRFIAAEGGGGGGQYNSVNSVDLALQLGRASLAGLGPFPRGFQPVTNWRGRPSFNPPFMGYDFDPSNIFYTPQLEDEYLRRGYLAGVGGGADRDPSPAIGNSIVWEFPRHTAPLLTGMLTAGQALCVAIMNVGSTNCPALDITFDVEKPGSST